MRQREGQEAIDRQKDQVDKLEADYSELAQEKAASDIEVARSTAAHREEIVELTAKQATLVAELQRVKAEPVLHAPELLKAALKAAQALIDAGKDLSSLPGELGRLVEIQPETRVKMVKAMFHGKVVSVQAVSDGQVLEETNPIAGQVGLRLAIRRYVEASIGGQKQNPPQDNGNAKAALLKGYEEVLAIHMEQLAVEKLDFQQLEDAVGRRINQAPRCAKDEYCMKPKYLAIAREAAQSGDLPAQLYLKECEGFFRREAAIGMGPSPSPGITK